MARDSDRSRLQRAHLAWNGVGYRHVPSDDPRVAVATDASTTHAGRWHSLGQETLYLAGDHPLVIAEYARHIPATHPLDFTRLFATRSILQIHARIPRVIDIRDPEVCQLLGVDQDPAWIRDVAHTRRIATMIRMDTDASGIIVPSMAFLDDATRWNLVLFRAKFLAWPEPSVVPGRIVGVITPALMLGISLQENPSAE